MKSALLDWEFHPFKENIVRDCKFIAVFHAINDILHDSIFVREPTK